LAHSFGGFIHDWMEHHGGCTRQSRIFTSQWGRERREEEGTGILLSPSRGHTQSHLYVLK
jgi:hypothetical protein